METNVTSNRKSYYQGLISSYLGNHLERLEIECADTPRPVVHLMYVDFQPAPIVRTHLQMMMPEVEFAEISREFSQAAYAFYFIESYLNNSFAISASNLKPTPIMDYITSGLYNTDLSQFDITFDVIDKSKQQHHE